MDIVLWWRGRSNSSRHAFFPWKRRWPSYDDRQWPFRREKEQMPRTWFIICCNLAPIIWLSKQQATIETSVFGAEFVAMKHRIKTLKGLRYKIRMMGIPLSGPTYIYGDNKSQVTNSSRPKSILKKKWHSICYHAIRELVATGETLPTHIRTGENLADFLTKTINGAKCRKLVSGVVYDIYNDFPDNRLDEIIRLTLVTQMTLRGLKEYAQAEGVLVELGVASESTADLLCENGVPETAEYCKKVPCISARPHIDIVPDGSVTGTRLTRADTCTKEHASGVWFPLTSVVCFITF